MTRLVGVMLGLALVTAGPAEAKGKADKRPPPPPPAEESLPEQPGGSLPADPDAAPAPAADAEVVAPAAAPADGATPPELPADGATPPEPPAAEATPPEAGPEPAPPEAAPEPAPPAAEAPAAPAAQRTLDTVSAVEVRTAVPSVEASTIAIDLRPPDAGAVIAVTPVRDMAADVPDEARTVFEATPVEEYVDDALDVPVRTRVLPVFPPELEVMYGDDPVRCDVLARIDARGKPLRVAVDCPSGFHLAALNALQRWRWSEPPGPVPEEGVTVRADVGFKRVERRYRPGVTGLVHGERVTGDLSHQPLLRSGKMPVYPRNVGYGDDVCLVELTVSASGASKDLLIDECSALYRTATAKALKGWKWYPMERDGETIPSQVQVQVLFRLESTPYRGRSTVE